MPPGWLLQDGHFWVKWVESISVQTVHVSEILTFCKAPSEPFLSRLPDVTCTRHESASSLLKKSGFFQSRMCRICRLKNLQETSKEY